MTRASTTWTTTFLTKMKLTNHKVALKNKTVDEVYDLEVGRNLCGLRFHAVTLSKKEFWYLIKNPEYAENLGTHFHASID